MTDYQLVRAAEQLIFKSDVKDALPPNYSLLQLAEATEALNVLAKAFVNKYGDRLSDLAPPLYRELQGW